MFAAQTVCETGYNASPSVAGLDYDSDISSESEGENGEFLSLVNFLMSENELNPHFNALLFSAVMSLLPSGSRLSLPEDCYNTFAKYFIDFKEFLQGKFPFTSIILSEELSSSRVAEHLEPEVFQSITTF
ncbi:hypothetical protein B9J93_02820 [Vibrio sp. V17_P4S1T151]|uniref:hypothetical protein n=1 Tax=unclassified Vibrio TaxID=2614977 RepID=UPI000B8E2AB3|nr:MULTISPECIES: hypothetical protein [unclassified Vibrio]OXX49278.1 hypothetical protein B9J93_02820 [Vibrio sp. V17_P4S1T151]OXX65318.1 hypothetical protein B9J89_05335 [Vibrio sp. V15_P4S5T153]